MTATQMQHKQRVITVGWHDATDCRRNIGETHAREAGEDNENSVRLFGERFEIDSDQFVVAFALARAVVARVHNRTIAIL